MLGDVCNSDCGREMVEVEERGGKGAYSKIAICFCSSCAAREYVADFVCEVVF